jgi:hypothetical protein
MLLGQHEQIHKGMDEFHDYLEAVKNGSHELDLDDLKQQLDTWGDVLLEHLDAEVIALGAENMRRHYTIPEMVKLRI